MSTKYKLILVALVLAATFAGGRFSAPTKVRVETKTVEVKTAITEQTATASQAREDDEDHETDVTETVKPDGTRVVETRMIAKTRTREEAQESHESVRIDQVAREQDKVKEVTRSRAALQVDLLAGAQVSLSSGLGPMVYGVHVSRELFGPVTVGLFGMSNGTAGVSVGLRF